MLQRLRKINFDCRLKHGRVVRKNFMKDRGPQSKYINVLNPVRNMNFDYRRKNGRGERKNFIEL